MTECIGIEQELKQLRQEHTSLFSAYIHMDDTREKETYKHLLNLNELRCTELQRQMNQQYCLETKQKLPHPPILRNVLRAFLVGGCICMIGQTVILFMQSYFSMDFKSASAMASITVVILTAILTGFGIYDEIGRFGGAGSMVPISGFSNSIVSAALEWKASGMIYGVGAKIFTIAGPVILYGTMASVFLGLIYYFVQ